MGGQAPHILIALRVLSALEFFGLQQQLKSVDDEHTKVMEETGQVLRFLHQLVRDSDLVTMMLSLLDLEFRIATKTLEFGTAYRFCTKIDMRAGIPESWGNIIPTGFGFLQCSGIWHSIPILYQNRYASRHSKA